MARGSARAHSQKDPPTPAMAVFGRPKGEQPQAEIATRRRPSSAHAGELKFVSQSNRAGIDGQLSSASSPASNASRTSSQAQRGWWKRPGKHSGMGFFSAPPPHLPQRDAAAIIVAAHAKPGTHTRNRASANNSTTRATRPPKVERMKDTGQ